MALLVRFIGSLAAWNEPNRERAVGNFVLRPGETGLSVWHASNDDERNLVVAAWCLKKARLEPVNYVHFDERTALEFGSIASSPGDSPLARINSLHRELCWPDADLRALAIRLVDLGIKAVRMSKPNVRAVLATIEPTDIAEPARGWVVSGFPRE